MHIMGYTGEQEVVDVEATSSMEAHFKYLCQARAMLIQWKNFQLENILENVGRPETLGTGDWRLETGEVGTLGLQGDN